MRHLNERVRFIRAVFKIAEWMSTVPGPCKEFHLVPGVRTKSPSEHHVTWTKDCLLKELRLRETAKTRSAINEEQRIMNRTQPPHPRYLHRAPAQCGVEHSVELPNFLQVTRIGFMQERAILAGMITWEKALVDVKKG
jgi:hypothetical protein